jgi:hypothetical protein
MFDSFHRAVPSRAGRQQTSYVMLRLEVFTALTMKNAVFWDEVPCRSCVNRRFGGTYRLHLQGRKIRERGTSVNRWLQTELNQRSMIFGLKKWTFVISDPWTQMSRSCGTCAVGRISHIESMGVRKKKTIKVEVLMAVMWKLLFSGMRRHAVW